MRKDIMKRLVRKAMIIVGCLLVCTLIGLMYRCWFIELPPPVSEAFGLTLGGRIISTLLTAFIVIFICLSIWEWSNPTQGDKDA